MSLTIRTRREGLAQWKFKLKGLKRKNKLGLEGITQV